MKYDLVIRNGDIVDGSGAPAFRGDVAVHGGVIVDVGAVAGAGAEEIDARGMIVTPGFVDPHTHYDGQVTWEDSTAPSANHGVTTVMIGNCGVGFAPCRIEDRDRLIKLMEGVEDIPEAVMAKGLPWNWESFPDYLDAVEARSRDVDTVALLPHACLRVYVMGERGAQREPATAEDLAAMTDITREAMEAGAIGFGTSRSMFHKSSEGDFIFSKDAAEAELQAIAKGMGQAGTGLIQALIDINEEEPALEELRLLERVARQSRRPITFSLFQLADAGDLWHKAVETTGDINRKGVKMTAQVMCRASGILFGFDLSTNPFSLHPTYRKLHSLPLAQKVAELRKPEIRARILSEEPTAQAGDQSLLRYIDGFDYMFPLGDPPNYEPPADTSIGAIARRRDLSPQEVAYDALLEDDGRASLLLTFLNYNKRTLNDVLSIMKDDNVIPGLGDGGAHYGMICDAGYPTYMLTYWARDRAGEQLPVETVIRWLTRDPAETIGLRDRGLVAPGYKADLNVIDHDRLRLHAPRATYDLPGGGRRLSQAATGYAATIVNGTVTYRNGIPTGALPGTLVRGEQHAP